MTDAATRNAAAALLDLAADAGVMIATAESCTGGLVAGALTDIPGSSRVVERGLVTYSNEAKTDLLGVDPTLIISHGAVSEPVARAMAEGALARSNAQLVVAITGVAGPGGTAAKPEGLVHFSTACDWGGVKPDMQRFGPVGRDAVRAAAVSHAIQLLTIELQNRPTA